MRTTRRTPAWLVLAGVLAFAPPAYAATPAPSTGLGIRLLDAPSNRADDPRARSYVVDQVKPGATFTRHVEISNGDPTAMDVVLYAAPAEIAHGGFEIADRGVPGLLSQWVTVSPDHAHLEPGGRLTATATFRVPSDASSGEVYGAIVVERPPQQTSQGVALGLRAGIRVYLSVGPGGEPPSDFTVDSLTAARDAAGNPLVLATVHNTGGRALDMSGTLRLTNGPGGLSAGPFPAKLGTTLGIGQSADVAVPLDKAVPAGPWTATLELESGLIKRKVEGQLTFPVRASSTSPPVTPRELPLYEKRSIVVPVAAGLILLVLLGLCAVWWVFGRGRKGR